jgi:hypothetical protein
MITRSLTAFLTVFLTAGVLFGQGQKPSVISGDVSSVASDKIVLTTKDGEVNVVLAASTQYKRVPADNPVLKAAVDSSLADISVGDKLMVTGILSEDKLTLPARGIYLMAKSDISQKQAKESERWATRGISGRVSAVNTAANQVTIDVRGLMNTTSVVVSAKDSAIFKRYRKDSNRYSEAVESSIADINPGDMLRAVGDRGADGATFAAEEVLTGAFQTIAGTVKSVDAAANTVVVTQAGTQNDITVAVTPLSTLKKFPEEMAQRMAGMGGPGGGIRPAGGAPGQQGGVRPAGGAPGGQPGAGGPGRGMGGRGGIDDMYERFPAIAVGDLKPGDVIAVSSSKSEDVTRVTAIKVLAGVGPFLAAAQAQAAAAGGGRRGGSVDLAIPGLEGFDNP